MTPDDPRPIVTVQRHLMEQQRLHPEATGTFTRLLWDLILAVKMINREVNKAGLIEILGLTGERNVHGEEVRRIDAYAHGRIVSAVERGGYLCGMASEESPDPIPLPPDAARGKYLLLFDPLDGSANIDTNQSIGSIFSILRRRTAGPDAAIEDFLQPGTQQIAAGYVLYGASTMLVYTTGLGVHGFTLDPSVGEFLLSNPNIRIPNKGKVYSANEGNSRAWNEGTRHYVDYLKDVDAASGRPYALRYIGTLVSDLHRTLFQGGIFLYPADVRDPARPNPKLRLLYECNPMALIIEQAGGKASTGRERILDIRPTELHQKVPIAIGSPEDVDRYESFIRQFHAP